MAVHVNQTEGETDKIFYISTILVGNNENKKDAALWKYRKYLLLFGSLTTLLLLSTVIWMIILVIKYESPVINNHFITTESTTCQTSAIANSENVGFSNNELMNCTSQNKSSLQIEVISRNRWVASPPTQHLQSIELPVPFVIIMHTATENCTNQANCVFKTRLIQSFHMESRGWSDIGYNFLVGGDGNVYEGRGWKYVGAHTYGYNSKSIGIAFIGTFNSILPPEKQIVAAQKIIQKGVNLKYLSPKYKLLAASQVQLTQSPGLMLYENLKTWPHWCEHI